MQGHSRKDTIIWRPCIKKQLHSSCHKDLWLSSFVFQLFFYFLCLNHYSPSFAIFNSHDDYFLLSATCVHNPLSNNHNKMTNGDKGFNHKWALFGHFDFFHRKEFFKGNMFFLIFIIPPMNYMVCVFLYINMNCLKMYKFH